MFMQNYLLGKLTVINWQMLREEKKTLKKFPFQINQMGKGQNYENHNVENQKELRKLRRRSEHQKD